MKLSSLRKPISVLLSLLLILSVFAGLSFSASANLSNVGILLDFCEGHEELAAAFAAQVESQANGSVVPVSVAVENGTVLEAIDSINEQLYSSGIMESLGEEQINNGEKFYGTGLKALTDYSDKTEYNAEMNSHWETEIHADDTLYVHWRQTAQSVSVTIAAPVCGTDVHFINEYAAGGGNSSPTTSPAPEITVTGDAILWRSPYHAYTDGYWTDNLYGGSFYYPYEGYLDTTFVGGESYYAAFQLEPNFGYFINDSTEILVNGQAPANRLSDTLYVASVTAVHDQGEISVVTPPTCTTPGVGSYVCAGCGQPRNDAVIPTTGHSYEVPVWAWADDCSVAVLTLGCTTCDAVTPHIAAITESRAEPTANQNGSVTYTACVTVDGTTYSDAKTVVLPATGSSDASDEPATQDGGDSKEKSNDSFFHTLYAWLIELVKMITRWFTK